MPHLTVEYSANLNLPADTLHRLNQTLIQSGHFEPLDIKSRAHRQDNFLIGTQTDGQAFVHAKLAIMQGRSPAIKAQIAAQLLNALEACMVNQPSPATQLCVEIIEIDNASYAKKVVGV